MSRRQVALLAAFALGIRLLYNVAVLGDYTPESDAGHYFALARSVADGEGLVSTFPFTEPEPHATAFRPPLYPLLLGAAMAVFGDSLLVAQLLNVALGVLVVVLAARLATRFYGAELGIAAGALVAVFPPLLANDGPPLSEPLSLSLLLAAALLLPAGHVVSAGLAVGALTLARPSAQGAAVVLGAWVLWRLGWRRALAFCACVSLVVAPWVYRNLAVLDSPVLLTSNGFNLAALYSPEARAEGRWIDPLFHPAFADLRRSVEPNDEVAIDAALRDLALRELRAHPLELVKRSALHVRSALEVDPGAAERPERLDGRDLGVRTASLPLVWSVLALGVPGLWLLGRSSQAQPFLLLVLMLTALSLLFSPMPPRLRAPLDLACRVAAPATAVRLIAHARGSGGVSSLPTRR